LGYFRERSRFNIFFLFFGLSVGLSAFLPHKPFIDGRPFSELLDQWHSALATLAGFSAVAAFVLKAIRGSTTGHRIIYGSIAAAYTILPIGMFALPQYLGLFQRIIFGSFILWVLIDRRDDYLGD
ncbi:MAG: hypothetical protein ACE5FV_05165, partial [Woeseia sp.]